jgi:endo-1,4-beta-xylanase
VPQFFNSGLFADVHMGNPWNYTLMPARGEFEFKELDFVLDWANRNGIRLHGHPLVWGSGGAHFFPSWFHDSVQPGTDGQELLRDYISQVLKHFRGQISTWNVVNEPFQPFSGEDYWLTKAGANYPHIAFSAARDADPESILVLNGVDNFIDTRVPIDIPPQYYDLVTSLVSERLLDGIGFELHIQGHRPVARDALERAVESFRAIGPELRIYFTEVDVNMQMVDGTDEERLATQAGIYRDVAESALALGVSGLYFFGNSDRYSWLRNLPPPWGGDQAQGTMFDEVGRPKPAYYAVADVLAAEAVRRGRVPEQQLPSPSRTP